MSITTFFELFIGAFIGTCVLYLFCCITDWVLRRITDDKDISE